MDGEVDTLVLELIFKVRSEARSIVVVVGVDSEVREWADRWFSESVDLIRVATISPAAGC